VRWALSLALSFLVCVPSPVFAAVNSEWRLLRGGTFDGLRMVIDRSGRLVPDSRLLPSLENTSPIPDRFRSVITTFLTGYGERDEQKFFSVISRAATFEFCPHGMRGPCERDETGINLGIAEPLEPNTPYYMPQSGSVRVEWLHDGELVTFSVLTLQRNKIVAIRTYIPSIVFYVPSAPSLTEPNGEAVFPSLARPPVSPSTSDTLRVNEIWSRPFLLSANFGGQNG
jgi:hypothetical protein